MCSFRVSLRRFTVDVHLRTASASLTKVVFWILSLKSSPIRTLQLTFVKNSDYFFLTFEQQTSFADRTSRLEQGQVLHCKSCLSGPLDKVKILSDFYVIKHSQAILHFTKTLDRLYENGHESGFASYAPYLAPYLEVFGCVKIISVNSRTSV